MEFIKIRVITASFYILLWLTFGVNVSLAISFLQFVVVPVLFAFSRRFRANCLYVPYTWPFERYDNPKIYGLEGVRNFKITYESTYDNCTINIGTWHILPKSLVKKHKFILNSGTKDELNKLFDDELKNSQHPIFVYFHGIFGSRASTYRVETYKFLQNLDAHVVTFDYRGFADSTDVSTTKMGAVEDALIVYSWVRGLVGDKPVFIWGHSIGSALAQRAVSKLKPYSLTLLKLKTPLPPPQGIVVEGGYNSNVDLSKDFIGCQIVNAVPLARRVVVNALKSLENRLFVQDYAEALKDCPLLMLHAKNDGVVPYQYGEKLYEKHREARKEGGGPLIFKTFESEGHLHICRNSSLPSIVMDFIKCSGTQKDS